MKDLAPLEFRPAHHLPFSEDDISRHPASNPVRVVQERMLQLLQLLHRAHACRCRCPNFAVIRSAWLQAGLLQSDQQLHRVRTLQAGTAKEAGAQSCQRPAVAVWMAYLLCMFSWKSMPRYVQLPQSVLPVGKNLVTKSSLGLTRTLHSDQTSWRCRRTSSHGQCSSENFIFSSAGWKICMQLQLAQQGWCTGLLALLPAWLSMTNTVFCSNQWV